MGLCNEGTVGISTVNKESKNLIEGARGSAGGFRDT